MDACRDRDAPGSTLGGVVLDRGIRHLPLPRRKHRAWSGHPRWLQRRPRNVPRLDDRPDSPLVTECLAIEVDTSLSAERVARVSDQVIKRQGCPAMLVVDNGLNSTAERSMPGHSVEASIRTSFAPATRRKMLRREFLRQVAVVEGAGSSTIRGNALNLCLPMRYQLRETGRTCSPEFTCRICSLGRGTINLEKRYVLLVL